MKNARQTAYKIWISNLINGKYIKQSGEWEPNYVECNGLKVSRVNILANVVEVNLGDNFSFVSIDDGSSTIQVKAFKDDAKLINDLKIGDVINVIGRPREYQNDIYILPEIVKRVINPKWVLVRKIELTNTFGDPEKREIIQTIAAEKNIGAVEAVQQKSEEQVIKYEVVNESTQNSRQKILNLIEKAGEEGLGMDSLIEKAGLSAEESEKVVNELLKEGEIYMPRPGQLKTI